MLFASRQLQSHRLHHLPQQPSMTLARRAIHLPILIVPAGIAPRRVSVPTYPPCRGLEHAVFRVFRLDGMPVYRPPRDRLGICPGRREAGRHQLPRPDRQKGACCHRHYLSGIRSYQYLDSKKQHTIEESWSQLNGRTRCYARGYGISSTLSKSIVRNG